MNGKNPFVHVFKVSSVEPGVEASHAYFVVGLANTDFTQLHGIISAETLDVLSLDHNLYIEINAPRKEHNP